MTTIQGNQGNKNVKKSKYRITSGIKHFKRKNDKNTWKPRE